jgi:hypothetical protein
MYLTEGAFAEAVDRLLALRRDGQAWLLISPDAVRFNLARNVASPELREQAREVSEAVSSVVRGESPEEFAQRRASPLARAFGYGEEEPESVDVAERKLQLVTERFDTAELARRHWLKQTSKTPTPATVEWDVATKYAEDMIDRPSEDAIPFGLVRFRARAVQVTPAEPISEVVMTVDSEDVDFVIGVLTELRATMGEVAG